MIRPRALSGPSTIGIVSPSSPQRDPQRLERGIAYLEGLGHTVVLAPHARSVYAEYLAGTDAERVADIHQMFTDPRIDAIFCARGGYGTPRILDLVDYELIARHPKIFVGFSDTTALQFAIYKKSGLVTFSGALPSVDMADEFDAESEEWFWRVLSSTKPLGQHHQSIPIQMLQAGAVDGVLLPGNLAMIGAILGTDYVPDLRGTIMVVEDIAEETYRIDRMLTQLRLHVKMNLETGGAGLGALCFGQFTPPAQRGNTPHREVLNLLEEQVSWVRGPVLANLMYGHESKKLTLPVGLPVRIHNNISSIDFYTAALTD
jgi:muramoyltetrapeptide carboxypeptidase